MYVSNVKSKIAVATSASAEGSVPAEAERVARRVEHDPELGGVAVGGLVGGDPGAGLDGEGDRVLDVVHLDLEVDHLVLDAGLLGPGRRDVPLLRLEAQADAAGRVPHRDPVRAVTGGHLPPQQVPVEPGHLLGVRTVQAHARPAHRARAHERDRTPNFGCTPAGATVDCPPVTVPRMHDEEVDVDDDLVRRLLAAQLPDLADLPVTR